jgi:hypothetical protein
MGLSPENKISLLQYKLFHEELEVVNDIFFAGQADLLVYVTNFRENLSKDVPGQRENFNQYFFGDSDIEKKDVEPQIPISESEDDIEATKKSHTPEKWAKMLFRKIVLATHPDKTMHIPIATMRNKFDKFYQLATSDFEKENYDSLLFIAFEIGIDFPEEKVPVYIDPKNKKFSKEIDTKKSSIAYQWQKVPDENKEVVLENYLTSLGYVFSKKEIKQTIERVKRIKRKTGTRPVNYIKKRLK